jgi:hypothetical protein
LAGKKLIDGIQIHGIAYSMSDCMENFECHSHVYETLFKYREIYADAFIWIHMKFCTMKTKNMNTLHRVYLALSWLIHDSYPGMLPCDSFHLIYDVIAQKNVGKICGVLPITEKMVNAVRFDLQTFIHLCMDFSLSVKFCVEDPVIWLTCKHHYIKIVE